MICCIPTQIYIISRFDFLKECFMVLRETEATEFYSKKLCVLKYILRSLMDKRKTTFFRQQREIYEYI